MSFFVIIISRRSFIFSVIVELLVDCEFVAYIKCIQVLVGSEIFDIVVKGNAPATELGECITLPNL